jgi:PAS domain S-box-containing protein
VETRTWELFYLGPQTSPWPQLSSGTAFTRIDMTTTEHQGPARAGAAWLAGLLVAVIGAFVLLGWAFDIPTLKSVFPGLVTMKANTAVELLLCGVALALLSDGKAGPPVRLCVTGMAVVAICLGGLTMGEYFFGWETGVDQWLFHDSSDPLVTSSPGRMSPSSAFCFVLMGGSLWLASQPMAKRLKLPAIEAMGVTIFIVGGFAVTGYVLDALFHLRWWSYTGMAVLTAAGFVLLGGGLLALVRSEGGFRWSLGALATGGFVVGIVSLLAVAGSSYYFINQLQQSAAWVSHTQEVLKKIEEVSAGVATLGSAQRNYINTGNEQFLKQEETLKAEIRHNLDGFRKLTADNPRQGVRADRLEPLLARRIEWGEQTIAARRKEGLAAAEQMIAAGTGTLLSGGIRQLIKEMEEDEYTLLDQRQKREQAISTTTYLLLPLGVFLSITLLCVGLFFLNSGVAERAMAEEKVAWLASFPERNPNPIVELDLATGVIHYMNAATARAFPDLQIQGLLHPWLAGLTEMHGALLESREQTARREVLAGGSFYTQTINYIPETKRLRVYGTDITDRKRAEEAAAQLSAIVEFSDDAIIGKDLQGIITSWNNGAERLFGYQACEMIGQPVRRLVPADRQQEETNILSRIQRGECVKHFDTLRLRKDGSLVPISATVSPIRDSSGKIVGESKVARDVTERKQAEEALRASEARYRMLFDYAPDGIVIVDFKGYYLDANASICRMLGYTRDEFIGLNASDIVAPAEFPHIDEALDVIKTKSDYQREWLFRHKDGSVFAVDTIATAMPDGNLLAMIRDITDRKRAQEALRQQAALFDQTYDAAIVWSWDGQITFWNRGAERLYGFSRAEALGRMSHELLRTKFPDSFNKFLLTLKQEGHWEGELEHITSDNRKITVETRMILVHEPDRTYVLEANRDVTERQRAEKALRESYENLERKVSERTAELQLAIERSEAAGRAKSEFMASMSHELRTPLNGIIGFSEFLVDGKPGALNPKQKEYLEDILNSGRHLLQLINDILDLAKVEAGKIEFNPEQFPMRKAIEEVRAVAGPIAQKKRIQVGLTIAPELNDITLDQMKFKQVVYNLLSNALKFTDTDGHVDIRCAPNGADRFTLAVKDTGIGIKPEDLTRLFKEFEQIDSGAGRRYEGTGLGLALTRKLVELQGGGIIVESEAGKGSTFTVTLPLTHQEALN